MGIQSYWIVLLVPLNMFYLCFSVFFLQEQAPKTVLEISLLVPLLISPLHEGIHYHGYLLDLQLNRSASKDQRETCQTQIISIKWEYAVLWVVAVQQCQPIANLFLLCLHKSKYSLAEVYLCFQKQHQWRIYFIPFVNIISCNCVFLL